MPGPRAADRPVVLDTYEEHPAGPVGQAHHRLDKLAIVQPFPLLAPELDFAGLPASDPPRDTRRQVRCLVSPTVSPCISSFYAELCDIIASLSSNAYNFARKRITALAARPRAADDRREAACTATAKTAADRQRFPPWAMNFRFQVGRSSPLAKPTRHTVPYHRVDPGQVWAIAATAVPALAQDLRPAR